MLNTVFISSSVKRAAVYLRKGSLYDPLLLLLELRLPRYTFILSHELLRDEPLSP